MEQPNLENIVRKNIVVANRLLKQLIQYNMLKFEENARKRLLFEDCCSPAVFDYLVSIILDYVQKKRLDNGQLLSETKLTTASGVVTILFYYYHMVLIESMSENVLKTTDMEKLGKEVYNIFMQLYPELVKGDNLLDASIRQKFLGFASNIRGTSSIAVPTGHPEEIQPETILPAPTIENKRKYPDLGGKKKHRKTRRKHKSKRGKSRRRRLRTTV
jgi:hypothetical protein